MKAILRSVFVVLALGLAALPAHAEDLLMARSPQAFPEAMLQLQELIKRQGYTVSRVQRVDIGLTQMGYVTDKYRVVFLGKAAEVEELIARHPELAAYLPLQIAIFAEGSDTLLIASHPERWRTLFPDAALVPVFERWAGDLQAIFDAMRHPE